MIEVRGSRVRLLDLFFAEARLRKQRGTVSDLNGTMLIYGTANLVYSAQIYLQFPRLFALPYLVMPSLPIAAGCGPSDNGSRARDLNRAPYVILPRAVLPLIGWGMGQRL
jgi:hypothetical protein